jgi:hypothetical protein
MECVVKNLFFAALAALSLGVAIAPAHAGWRTTDTTTQRAHQD